MIRTAGLADLATLGELEQAASSAGLAHVFGEIPFPMDDVLARWRLVLEEPGIATVLDLHDSTPVGYAAFGDGWIRHFGVHPEWWGTGRASALHAHVISALTSERADAAADPLRLWVLEENHRARAFYARLGWVDTGVREAEVFEPYPVKMQMAWSRPALV